MLITRRKLYCFRPYLRPLEDLSYLASETPEGPSVDIYRFDQKQLKKKIERLALMAGPKRPFFPCNFSSDLGTILNSRKFPGADSKDLSVKSILPTQNGFTDFFRD